MLLSSYFFVSLSWKYEENGASWWDEFEILFFFSSSFHSWLWLFLLYFFFLHMKTTQKIAQWSEDILRDERRVFFFCTIKIDSVERNFLLEFNRDFTVQVANNNRTNLHFSLLLIFLCDIFGKSFFFNFFLKSYKSWLLFRFQENIKKNF